MTSEVERLRAQLELARRERETAIEISDVAARITQRINSHPADMDGNLREICDGATRLTHAYGAVVYFIDGEYLRTGGVSYVQLGDATHPSEMVDVVSIHSDWPIARAVREGAVAQEHDFLAFLKSPERPWRRPDDEAYVAYVEREGFRTVMAVPLGTAPALGALCVLRPEVRPFDAREVSTLEAFAAQAVNAIETARLFNELQQRNADITESLRREEASADILRMISQAPEDLATTLQAIPSATQRFTGMASGLFLIEDGKAIIRGVGASDDIIANGLCVDAVIGTPSYINDLPEYADLLTLRAPHVYNWDQLTDAQRALQPYGTRSLAFVPIWGGDTLLGLMNITNTTGETITPAIIAMLETFANQAAIAIENARLIRELRDSNREINENLDIRRVMGEVLAIVASAPTDLERTMPKIAEAAMMLSQSHSAGISWLDGDQPYIYVVTADGSWTNTGIRALPKGPMASIGSTARIEGRLVEFTGTAAEFARKWPANAAIVADLELTEFSSVAVPMFGPQGAIGAIVINRHDTTEVSERARSLLGALATQAVVAVENARLFRELQAKTDELEVASQHKSEFLATMSHELRTPLNAIIGYAELLQEECGDLGQSDFLPDLGRIHSAGKHLLQLINGVLDLSKVEAGRMTLFLEDIDVAALVRDAESITRPLVEKNGNRFVIDCPAGIGAMHADLVKVRQVLFNLISNAAKFTQAGTIGLRVRRDDAGHLIFELRDSGIGITPDQIARLFQAFSQADPETSRKYGGTGLGLALSREFCRMMGGDISVLSEAGAGSTFTVTLPALVVESPTDADPSAA